jgi:hypothetical protein
MIPYTVGTQRDGFGPFEDQIWVGLNPHRTASSALYPLCTFKKNGGNTQWRVCRGAHTPCCALGSGSWYTFRYTVVHSEDVAGEIREGPGTLRPRCEAMTRHRNAPSARGVRK